MRGMLRSVTTARTGLEPPSRIRRASTAEGVMSTERPGMPRKAISSMAALFSESSTIRTAGIPLLSSIQDTVYQGKPVNFEGRGTRESGDEPVPDAMDGEEVARGIAIRFEL